MAKQRKRGSKNQGNWDGDEESGGGETWDGAS